MRMCYIYIYTCVCVLYVYTYMRVCEQEGRASDGRESVSATHSQAPNASSSKKKHEWVSVNDGTGCSVCVVV
jgi:uncharacterized ion transporter superfamily protein YfcC